MPDAPLSAADQVAVCAARLAIGTGLFVTASFAPSAIKFLEDNVTDAVLKGTWKDHLTGRLVTGGVSIPKLAVLSGLAYGLAKVRDE